MNTLSSRVGYENPWLTLREDQVEREDGSTGVYSVVERPDFAMVTPFERGGFHLVEQHRYPVGRRSWECHRHAGGAGRGRAGGEGRSNTCCATALSPTGRRWRPTDYVR